MDSFFCKFWIWLINNVGVVVNVATAVFIFWQVKVEREQLEELKKEYQRQSKKESFEASFRLTDFYMSKVLSKSSAATFLFKKSGLYKEFFGKIRNSNINFFDKEEATEIFGCENSEIVKNIQEKLRNLDVKVLVEAVSIARNITISQAYVECVVPVFSKNGSNVADENDNSSDFDDAKKELFVLLWGELVQMMNELEYFSMYFNSDLASDKRVYDSVHQTYIDTVCLCYPLLCSKNTRAISSRRYYTNVRELYVRWRNREIEKENEAKKNLESEMLFDSWRKKI